MMTVTTTSTSGYITWNGPPFANTTVSVNTYPMTVQKRWPRPTHMFKPIPQFLDCLDCEPGSPYSTDSAAHPYVIREWEIG